MKKLIASILTAAFAFSMSVAPVAAGCDPGRSNTAGSYGLERRMSTNPGVIFYGVEATIEEDNVFLESGGLVSQFIRLESDTSATRSIAAGIDSSSANGERLYVFATEPSGNVGPIYYDLPESASSANIRIVRVTSSKYEVFSGSTKIAPSIFFDSGWDAKYAEQYITSNNNGNQIPGRIANAAYFLNGEYTTQYGTAAFGGSFFAHPFPSGVNAGANSTGMYTWDRC